MNYLLDTNIISEIRKRSAHEQVKEWVLKKSPQQLFISCITIGEIKAGALKRLKENPPEGQVLLNWLEELINQYTDQILPIDLSVSQIWGELLAIDRTNRIDALIAAQGITHHMCIVTRNIEHFKNFNVKLINPFDNQGY
jgi:predicted nucleic acid-binding protein